MGTTSRGVLAALAALACSLLMPVSAALAVTVPGTATAVPGTARAAAVSTAPAYPVIGAVRGAWLAAGGASGGWGSAIGPERVSVNGGVYQLFAKGTAYWTPAGGAHLVHGAIRDAYGARGYEKGDTGYPIGDERPSVNGGVYQVFQHGTAYWTPAGGAHLVSGAIMSAYGVRGYERGGLGYPITDAVSVTGGLTQVFQGGRLTRSAQTGAVVASADTGQTVNGARFDAGSIISDAEFFKPPTMSAQDIRLWLHDRNPSCVSGADGSVCLQSYRASAPDMDTAYCAPYPAGTNEDAATIIAKASTACGINPKVLLVILQKEQGLVLGSGTGLTATRYARATGFQCPDNTPCDASYAGLPSQLYYAASRLVQYGAQPASFTYRAGGTYTVAYNPSTACGGSVVVIRNRATAALYNYTPYQPNAASLANVSGSGDSCSTYGNRNFWRYYRTWFGSTGV